MGESVPWDGRVAKRTAPAPGIRSSPRTKTQDPTVAISPVVSQIAQNAAWLVAIDISTSAAGMKKG